MTASTPIKLVPWVTPNFAVLDLEGEGSAHCGPASVSIKNMSEEALATMAMAWIQDLYKKSGYTSPFVFSEDSGVLV